MSDPLGFGSNAPNVVITRPADNRVFGAVDTYAKDCSSPGAGDGTGVWAAWGNGIIGQLRAVIRGNGQTLGLTDVVPVDNSDDTMVLRSIQALIQRGQMFIANDTGTPNAVLVALDPAPAELRNGLRLSIWIANDNTGATTININGLGLLPITRNDGSDLQRRDLRAGCLANFNVAHGSCRLEMPVAFSNASRIVTSSAVLNLTLQDRAIALFRTAGVAAMTINLPPGASASATIIVDDVAGNLSGANATVVAPGGETIAGAASYVMDRDFQTTTYRFYTDGATRIWSRST